jgi:hypothetical protein
VPLQQVHIIGHRSQSSGSVRCQIGEKIEVPGRVSFALDKNANLTEAILFSKIDPLTEGNEEVYDVVLIGRFLTRKDSIRH